MLEIINLYNEIYNIYNELWILELQGMKELDLFNELVDKLKKCLKIEDELFSYLIKDYKYDYDEIVKMINNASDNVYVRKRMYDYLMMYKMIYSKNIKIYKSIDKLNRLYMSGFRNMYLLYFSYLDEFIDKEIDIEIKNSLLKLKYMETFYNHDMESILIMNDFSIAINNYVDLDMVDRIVNLPFGMDEVNANYMDIILGLVCEILDIDDSEYYDKNKLVLIVGNQCMFRACLSLISEEQYISINKEIYNIINNSSNDNNRNSVLLIKSIIDMRIKDRERVRRLSF